MRVKRDAWLRLCAVFALSLWASPARADHPDARRWVDAAKAALDAGKMEEALEAIERAYRIDPQPSLLNNLGFVLESLGRYADAAAAYRAVIADPEATPELRALDEQRLAALAPKLETALVYFTRVELGTLVFVGGASSEHEGEQAVAAGRSLLVIRSASGSELTVRLLELAKGRRTTIDAAELAMNVSDGFVRFEGGRLRSLSIDGLELPWPPDPGVRIRLVEGAHVLHAITADGDRSTHELAVARGETIALMRSTVEAPAVAREEGEPQLAPWILAGAGVAAGVAGGVLLALAHADAARIEDAARDAPITRLTYAEAVELEARASTTAPLGVGLLLSGAVAAAAGGLWAMLAAAND